MISDIERELAAVAQNAEIRYRTTMHLVATTASLLRLAQGQDSEFLATVERFNGVAPPNGVPTNGGRLNEQPLPASSPQPQQANTLRTAMNRAEEGERSYPSERQPMSPQYSYANGAGHRPAPYDPNGGY